jgi:hypothetical protein
MFLFEFGLCSVFVVTIHEDMVRLWLTAGKQSPLCSTVGTTLERWRSHLLKHLVQPLKRTVQMKF